MSDLVPKSGDEPTKKKSFKDYEPGFIHIDVKHLRQMPDEDTRRYLFVAIDCATRWDLTPIQALKEWQQEKPELFVKRVYNQAGLDI